MALRSLPTGSGTQHQQASRLACPCSEQNSAQNCHVVSANAKKCCQVADCSDRVDKTGQHIKHKTRSRLPLARMISLLRRNRGVDLTSTASIHESEPDMDTGRGNLLTRLHCEDWLYRWVCTTSWPGRLGCCRGGD